MNKMNAIADATDAILREYELATGNRPSDEFEAKVWNIVRKAVEVTR